MNDNLDLTDFSRLEEGGRRQLGDEAQTHHPPTQKNRGKILVVDDEFEVVRALTMRLKHAGYDIITAADGASATRLAITAQPDLVILDIGMPCGDGFTVAQRLAENTNTIVMPIIFLTARTSQADRLKGMSLGAVDFITKPYTSEQLLASVEKALYGTEPKAA